MYGPISSARHGINPCKSVSSSLDKDVLCPAYNVNRVIWMPHLEKSLRIRNTRSFFYSIGMITDGYVLGWEWGPG
jgi:hypothetical protein